MALELKVNENGVPVLDDQKRITYIDDSDGKELFLDPPGMYQKIIELGKENKKHREKYEGLSKKYKIFDSIEDPAKYKEEADKALDTIKNFNDKDYLKAEKVEQLKREMSSAYEEKLKQKDVSFSEKEKDYLGKMDILGGKIRKLLVSNKFSSSSYFNGGEGAKTILLPDIAESYFGKNFKVEEEGENLSVKAYYDNGDLVTSRIKPGEPAEFDEAIGLIIDRYPGKDSILRSGASGPGGNSGTGGRTTDSSDLVNLKTQYEEAKKNSNMQLAVALKHKIFNIERKQRA